MAPKVLKKASGIAVGYNKGHIVTKRHIGGKKKKTQPKKKKGLSLRKQLVKDVIREVAGFSPYEKRLIEMIKIGTAVTARRSLKFAKKRLGSHRRAKAKRDEIQEYVMAQRRKAAEKH